MLLVEKDLYKLVYGKDMKSIQSADEIRRWEIKDTKYQQYIIQQLFENDVHVITKVGAREVVCGFLIKVYEIKDVSMKLHPRKKEILQIKMHESKRLGDYMSIFRSLVDYLLPCDALISNEIFLASIYTMYEGVVLIWGLIIEN